MDRSDSSYRSILGEEGFCHIEAVEKGPSLASKELSDPRAFNAVVHDVPART